MKIFSSKWIDKVLGITSLMDGMAIEMGLRGVGEIPVYNVLADNVINGNANVNYLEADSSRTLTFDGFVDGTESSVVIKNTHTSDILVEFDGGFMSDSDRVKVITPGKKTVYSLTGSNGEVFVSILSENTDIGI